MNLKHFATVLALGVMSTVAAYATPLTGQFSITGSSVTDNGTTLTFQPNTVQTGAAATLTNSFAALLTPGEMGTITSPINYANYVPGSSTITFTNANDSVAFTLASLTEITNGAFGNFTGTGTITTSAAGFDSTPGTLLFTTQGNGVTTFSATATTPSAVPEPSTLSLLGTGLFGVAGLVKRRLMA